MKTGYSASPLIRSSLKCPDHLGRVKLLPRPASKSSRRFIDGFVIPEPLSLMAGCFAAPLFVQSTYVFLARCLFELLRAWPAQNPASRNNGASERPSTMRARRHSGRSGDACLRSVLAAVFVAENCCVVISCGWVYGGEGARKLAAVGRIRMEPVFESCSRRAALKLATAPKSN